MDTRTYCVFIILLVITTLAFLKYNIFVYEKFEAPTKCTISPSQQEEIWRSFEKIKSIMTDLKEYQWPDTNAFLIMYTVYVTRLEYLLNTYGNKLSKKHILPMLMIGKITDTINYFTEQHSGLLQEVFEEMLSILSILETNISNTCPVCDSIYIKRNLELIDDEFSMYLSTLFPENFGEIDQPTKQLLAQIEVDMLKVTYIIDRAISNQKLDVKGRLDSTLIDAKLKDLEGNFILVSTDLNLYKFLQKSVDDIGTFIELKKLIVEDLKQCVLTPVVYDACNYTGKKVYLIEGRYMMSELYEHYAISRVLSIQIPSNYTVVFHMNNGDVKVNGIDLPCIKERDIDIITIALKKKPL